MQKLKGVLYKILGMQESWVASCILKENSDSPAHHVADVTQVEHVRSLFTVTVKERLVDQ